MGSDTFQVTGERSENLRGYGLTIKVGVLNFTICQGQKEIK